MPTRNSKEEMKMDMEIFSQRLRELRVKKGLTQKQMAEFLKIDRTTYTNYEHGRIPDIKTIRNVARFFGVSLDWLLGVDNNSAIKSLDFEGKWPEGAQIFRRASTEWDERRKEEVTQMLKALFNNHLHNTLNNKEKGEEK